MSWICFHIENERLLKNTVSEEIRVECDKLMPQSGQRTDLGKALCMQQFFHSVFKKRSIIICYVMNSMKESYRRNVSARWKFYYC